MLEIKNLTKKYGNLTVYENFSLTVGDGEVLALMGDSGSGKTTLLNILAGLTGYEGVIEGLPEKVGYVFQHDRLVPHFTVLENLTLVGDKEKAEKYLAAAGLEEFKNEYPARLSAGMSRRVAILRAFLYGAPLLLLDEPFRNLDLSLKLRLMEFFKSLNAEEKRTVIFVTHDPGEAEFIADRAVVVKRGGEVLFDGRGFTAKDIEKIFIG